MTEDEENDIDLIERYHRGELEAGELQSLKDRMTADPSFAQKVEDFRDIFIGIKAHGESRFAAEVAGWEKEIREKNPVVRATGPVFNWKIAAGLFLVIAVGATIVLFNNKNSSSLYDEYFTPYEDVITLRGSEGIMDAYNKKDYPEAARQMEAYLLAAPRNLNVRFYYGVSLIASDKTKEGIAELERVIEGNGLLRGQAEWYRALALLKLDDIDAAKEQLRRIKPGHDYYEKATQLLQRLSQ